MPHPVTVPSGTVVVTDAQVALAESILAAVLQIMVNGTSGGSVVTPPMLLPTGPDPSIDPITGRPGVGASQLQSAGEQLFLRQLVQALAITLSTFSTGKLPLYTSDAVPAASAELVGTLIMVRDAEADGVVQVCRQLVDGSYEWATLAFVTPPV